MKTHNLSDKLKHPVFKVAAQICKEYHIEAYVIGGFVRDLLLERPSKDIDIVVVGDGVEYAKQCANTLRVKKVSIFKIDQKNFTNLSKLNQYYVIDNIKNRNLEFLSKYSLEEWII